MTDLEDIDLTFKAGDIQDSDADAVLELTDFEGIVEEEESESTEPRSSEKGSELSEFEDPENEPDDFSC
ncbi:MAG: hypothetical protein U5R06_17345 [candidate division KSB1 bacterium]|nr:hypothetical protein [candidate division KSB1 bacterium]